MGRALSAARGTELTWLELVLLWGLVDEDLVVVRGAEEARVPRCDLERLARLPHEVLAVVPAEVAVEHRLVPMWLERDGDLRVAMVDPTDEEAVEELEFFCDRRVLREVAPASAVAWAHHRYYGIASALWPPRSSLRSVGARSAS